MYISSKKILLLCLPVFMLAVLQTACKKEDKFPSQTLPQIREVNPASAMPGTSVDIKGSNLQNVTAVRFGTTEATFNAASDTSITAIVPDSLAPGDLYVQVYVGDGVAYAAKNFTVLEIPKVPDITSVDPAIAYPGDQVILTGINFTNVSAVKFGETIADFTITSDTKITTSVPANATGGNQLITVAAATGSDTSSFTVDLSPVISSFSPDQAKEGDLITVTGVRFTGATSVKLGALDVSFTFVDDNTITFVVPAGAISGTITITTTNGTATSGSSLSIIAAGLAFPIYDEGVTANWTNSGWIGGGWGGTVNYSSTSTVESGLYSAQIDYVGGYGSPLQLGGASIDLTPYTTFKISIYGAPGSNGKSINIGINQADAYTITVVEGQWTDYQIPLSNLTASSTLTDIWIKEYSGTGGFTIYVDNMGLN